ncbi:MAG: hypothetical protein ACI9Y1_003622, partial [Lentisphaeria bacterium]
MNNVMRKRLGRRKGGKKNSDNTGELHSSVAVKP